ncbi:MAG TPA: sensor histidine kinase [Caulobacteraceae bacterium]|nr:sensor histidine kinase [Caulobacteraceae bacterium]
MAAHMQILAEAANSLALAVVAASDTPLLLLDDNLVLIAASASFCRAFRIDPASVPGRRLAELGAGEWNVPQLVSLLTATAGGRAEVEAYEMDLEFGRGETRRIVVNAHKLDYADADHVCVLLSISDVTEARLAAKLKDDLLREKAVLLHELQHRIANSLQIIASILLQSARRAHSDGTRTQLYDAHNRVMSVAAVQKQLAASRLGDVELRPYFTELCRSIGASMIRDPKQLSLDVTVDDSVTSADISVSLGLVVTELVINALKHAFPGRRPGKITVDYRSDPTRWTLSVSDNGVGMPKDVASQKPGLGTSIVEALTKQLDADFAISDARPGVRATVTHTLSTYQ